MTAPTVKLSDFTQVPNRVIESDLHETTIVGFIRFLRRFKTQGFFDGSLGELRRRLRMAKTTVHRMIDDWIRAGWVQKEDTDIGMRLTILMHTLYPQKAEDAQQSSKSEQHGLSQQNSTVPNRNSTVSARNSSVPQRNTAVPNRNSAVPKINTAVPTASSKSGGNRGNLNIYPCNTQEEYREGKSVQHTEPLPPDLPPSSFSCDESTNDVPVSPLKKGLLALSAKHLAPMRKEDDLERAVTALAERLEKLAHLVGDEEALRQEEILILYLKHVERFWKDHHALLTMAKVEKYHDEMVNKAKGWTPPAEATRLYPEPELPTPQTTTQDMPLSSSTEVIHASLIGMSYAETEALDMLICEQYPGMQARYGSFPDGSYCVSLYVDGFSWCDLHSRREWYHPRPEQRDLIRCAIAAYSQYSRVQEPLAVGVAS